MTKVQAARASLKGEMKSLKLGDARLNARGQRLAAAAIAKPLRELSEHGGK
jgi:hypothetical protein